MERHDLTADGAFQVLRRASSYSNRKLAVIAEELVQTDICPRHEAWTKGPARLAATGRPQPSSPPSTLPPPALQPLVDHAAWLTERSGELRKRSSRLGSPQHLRSATNPERTS